MIPVTLAVPASTLTLSEIITYALIPAIITLATAIGFMYRQGIDRLKRTEKKWDECEIKHGETTQKLIDLSIEVGELRGRVTEREVIVESVAQAVVNRVEGARN